MIFIRHQKKKDTEQPVSLKSDFSENDYATAIDYSIDNRFKEKEAAYNLSLGITDSTTYYEDEYGNVQITNNYYDGANYDFDNEYYDYEYASRIKRFRRGTANHSYYDDYYTNYYWYDQNPTNYGTSIYTSYNWWSPGYSTVNVGWSYYGGWSLGWNWGWGYTGNYGYCGTGNYGYHGVYGNHVSSYYQNGFGGYGNQNVYASNYYNSYDGNSHYYGKRGRSSNHSGYGIGGGRKSTSVHTSFGQKYEASVKAHSPISTVRNTIRKGGEKPVTRNNGYSNIRTTHPITRTTKKVYTNPRATIPRNTTRTPRGNTAPARTTRTNRTNSSSPYTRPKTSNTRATRPAITRPATTTRTRSTYSNPKTRTTTRPKSIYTRPKSNSRSNYSKPSGSYNRSKGSSRTRSTGNFGGSRSRSTSVGTKRR